MTAPFKIVALYKFVDQPDFAELRDPIDAFCRNRTISGTLLLAPEGINGTVAGAPDAIAALVDWLTADDLFGGRFAGAEIKYSEARENPFYRLKVRLKTEIVTLRAPQANPGKMAGTYVAPQDWNALIADEEVLVLDTRNDYEVALGSFETARDPGTGSFTQFKDYVAENLDPARHRKIAMFCTGGIRCEKASAYMLSEGFETVYHLKGGILAYLEQIPRDQSRWTGECFVFDERVSVGHGLEVGEATLCRACRQPLTPRDREKPEFVEGVQCHHCAGTLSERKRAGAAERQRQIALAAARGEAHIGDGANRTARARKAASKARRDKDRARN